MALAYSDPKIWSIRDSHGQLKGYWIKETVTWDGVATNYVFPNQDFRQDVNGRLFKFKGFLSDNTNCGDGHAPLVQLFNGEQHFALPIGKYSVDDDDSFGEVIGNGPLYDGSMSWDTIARIIDISYESAPTSAGTSVVVVQLELVD